MRLKPSRDSPGSSWCRRNDPVRRLGFGFGRATTFGNSFHEKDPNVVLVAYLPQASTRPSLPTEMDPKGGCETRPAHGDSPLEVLVSGSSEPLPNLVTLSLPYILDEDMDFAYSARRSSRES